MAWMRPIKIERITSNKDSEGNMIESASLIYSGFAEVEELSGDRRFADAFVQGIKTYSFLIWNRFIPILNTDAVIYDGKRLTVTNVIKEGERLFKIRVIANGSI